MRLRSVLFVPADSERKLAKSVSSPADALVLDLEDAVVESHKIGARSTAAEFITAHHASTKAALFVRINPLDTSFALGDLAKVVVPGLAGIFLPKTRGVTELQRLGHYLDALEARAGMEPGSVRILPVATETAQAMLNMSGFAAPGFAASTPRLAAVTWGAEDLSTAIGALSNREEDGRYSPLYDLASSFCLCAAAAAGVPALETMHGDFRDQDGLAHACRVSRRRGFRGRIAIHPDQVPIINECYSPTAAELAHARLIVDAFAAHPDAGTLSIDGVMYDRPHLTQAQHTLSTTD